MKKIIFTVLLLSIFSGPAIWASANSYNKVQTKFSDEEIQNNLKKWSVCTDSDECVRIQGGCGFECVNINVKEEAESYFRLYGTMISCVDRHLEAKPEPICRQSQCVCEYPGEVNK